MRVPAPCRSRSSSAVSPRHRQRGRRRRPTRATCCRRRRSSTSSTSPGRPRCSSARRATWSPCSSTRRCRPSPSCRGRCCGSPGCASIRRPTAATAPAPPARSMLKAVADGADAAGDTAAVAGADLARLLCRRRALRVHADAADRHRAVGGRDRDGTRRGACRAPISTPCWPRRAPGWAPATSLLCATTVPGRGAAPALPAVPTGPNVQEHRGGVSPVRTYQDLLTSAHDEALFEYYGSEPAGDGECDHRRPHAARPARDCTRRCCRRPTASTRLVTRLSKPYSRLVPYVDFAKSVEVWDRVGAITRTIATLPVADDVPNGGVLPGPRSFRWHPLEPATLAWVEALDGGEPEDAGAAARSDQHAGGAVQGRARRAGAHRVPLQRPVLDGCRRGALLGVRSHAPLDPHLGARQARRGPAQAVGSQRRGSLRRSGHGAAPHARLGHRVDRAERRHDLPGRRRRLAAGRQAVPRHAEPQHAAAGAQVPDDRGLRADRRAAVRRRIARAHPLRDPQHAAGDAGPLDRRRPARDADDRPPIRRRSSRARRSSSSPTRGPTACSSRPRSTRRPGGRRRRAGCRCCSGPIRASSSIPMPPARSPDRRSASPA